jgi:hypothetical protein
MMDEAYTIGIRLALDDGVTAGIAAIGADLARLEQAMAAIRPVPVVAARVADEAPAVAAVVPEERAADAPVVARAVPREVPVPAAWVVAPVVVPADVVPPPLSPVVQQAVPQPVSPVVAAPVVSLVAPAPVAAVAERRTVVREVGAPVVAPAVRSAPVARVLSPMAPPRVETSQAVAPVLPEVPAPVMPAPVVVAAPVERPATERLHQVVTREAVAVAPRAEASAEMPRAVAPVTGSAPAVAPVLRMPAAEMKPMAPPAVPQSGGGPAQGDVFLDGVRMGRWMANTLAKEASRPQGGSTQFDPRMGVPWPGTLQGG